MEAVVVFYRDVGFHLCVQINRLSRVNLLLIVEEENTPSSLL